MNNASSTLIKRPPKLAIAPMMDYSDRHFRYLMRLISPHSWLYTEMVTADAIIHADNLAYLLDYSAKEHPVALQLGGSNPKKLAQATKLAEPWNYDEINLNVGCPSDRVQSGRFGACLMAEPNLVAECVSAIASETQKPVTIKTRLGIDQHDSYEFLCQFIEAVSAVGCQEFTIHARKAWLTGLSPKENRTIPPLDYPRVYQLKKDFNKLTIIINGGIISTEAVLQHLKYTDGVMIGRAACNQSFWIQELDKQLFLNPEQQPLSRQHILELYYDYMKQQSQHNTPLSILIKPLLGLFQGLPGARQWRRHLSEIIARSNTVPNLLEYAPL